MRMLQNYDFMPQSNEYHHAGVWAEYYKMRRA